jgi:hypothetical protein
MGRCDRRGDRSARPGLKRDEFAVRTENLIRGRESGGFLIHRIKFPDRDGNFPAPPKKFPLPPPREFVCNPLSLLCRREFRFQRPKNEKFPVNFPVSRESGRETGSLRTASSTTQSRHFARPIRHLKKSPVFTCFSRLAGPASVAETGIAVITAAISAIVSAGALPGQHQRQYVNRGRPTRMLGTDGGAAPAGIRLKSLEDGSNGYGIDRAEFTKLRITL